MKLTNGCAIFGDKNGPQGSGTYFSINKVMASLRAPSYANLGKWLFDNVIKHQISSIGNDIIWLDYCSSMLLISHRTAMQSPQ